MVRNRVRKTTMGQHSEQNMREAIALVEGGSSLRNAANQKHVNYMTLSRYIKKIKNKAEEDIENVNLTPNYANRKIFSDNLEKDLKEYILTCSKMSYGLDTVECRKLAYEMAVFHQIEMPKNWVEKKIAGVDWLYGFRKRQPDLTLRKPEPCSLTRATSFNRYNVNTFYNNLQDVMSRNRCFSDGTRVFCLDETGTTTVQKPKKILAAKGAKQLNKVTSAERGTLVTTCCAVSATGSALAPTMVFPRKVFKPFMIKDAPLGTLGLAQPTGWMTGELFVEVMKYFIKATSSSKDNPSLLIFDNHESHLAPAVLNLAKDNGVTLLTIPPHTSHKLQPLDVSVFGPFQTYYNSAADSWMMRHPGRALSIYDVAGLVGQAFDRAMTPVNIKSGFRKTGIFPFDRDIFSENDFMPSEITNRPYTSVEQTRPSGSQSDFPAAAGSEFCATKSNSNKRSESLPQLILPSEEEIQPEQLSPSLLTETYDSEKGEDHELLRRDQLTEDQPYLQKDPPKHLIPIKENQLRSPIGCRDYPKAQPRVQCNKGRKRGRSCIATDTPIKREFEEAALKRNKNVTAKERRLTVKENKLKTKEKLRKSKLEVKKVLFDDSDDTLSILSDDTGDFPLSCHKKPEREDFVVVKFPGKQQKVKHYIGKLVSDNEDDAYDINYLRKSSKVDSNFYFPLEPDVATVGLEDIEIVLPVLEKNKNMTKRQADCYVVPKFILKKFNLQ